MIISIGSDHGGFEMKQQIADYLKSIGHELIDCGAYDTSSVDYPDIAHDVCENITNGKAHLGILICTTGIGMCMCANKHKGIRAAQCHDPHTAKMTRKHNNANVLTFGGKIIGIELAKQVVDAFLTNDFEGGRHQRRVDKMMNFDD